jgi:hypothetical protein
MESSSGHLLGGDIERILEEPLSDSESSLFDSDGDFSAVEGSDSDSVGNSTSPLEGGAGNTFFGGEDMSNYVGRGERFVEILAHKMK